MRTSTPTAEVPKYAQVQYERRWLTLRDDWRSVREPYAKRLEDRYLACGRLRLRVMTDLDSGRVVRKLTKKYEAPDRRAQPIVTVYLTDAEHNALSALAGYGLSKVRHYVVLAGQPFSLDVFEGEHAGLVLCEVESDSVEELAAIRVPSFADVEVTEEPFFQGGNLCRANRAEVLQRLSELAPPPR